MSRRKYVQLARDAQSSGDPVGAENYFQHAEHYFRLIATAQEQFRQNPSNAFYRPEGGGGNESRDETFEDGDDEGLPQPQTGAAEQPAFGTRDPQPYLPRDAQFFSPREQQQQGRQPMPQRNEDDGGVDRLPSFITGGQPQDSRDSRDSHRARTAATKAGRRRPLPAPSPPAAPSRPARRHAVAKRRV